FRPSRRRAPGPPAGFLDGFSATALYFLSPGYSFSQVTSTSLAFLLAFSSTSHLPRSFCVSAPFLGIFSLWQYMQLSAGNPAALAFFWMSSVADDVPEISIPPHQTSTTIASPSPAPVFFIRRPPLSRAPKRSRRGQHYSAFFSVAGGFPSCPLVGLAGAPGDQRRKIPYRLAS